MNFLRDFISKTKFYQIDNLEGYVQGCIKSSFPLESFKNNSCWENNSKFQISKSKVKSLS